MRTGFFRQVHAPPPSMALGDKIYLLTGVQLFGQFFYKVLSVGVSQSGGPHGVVDRCHLLMEHQHINTESTQQHVCSVSVNLLG